MATASPPPSPDIPSVKEFKSAQYEFNDEQNRAISGLTDAMRVVAGLLQLLGLAFVVLCALTATGALKAGVLSGYGPPIGFGVAALLFLCIGFWTGGAATSFRKVVETKNEDVWHLMNALGSLRNMYGLLRTIILGGLVLSVIAGAMIAFAWMDK
jgi:hypothetical protein